MVVFLPRLEGGSDEDNDLGGGGEATDRKITPESGLQKDAL